MVAPGGFCGRVALADVRSHCGKQAAKGGAARLHSAAELIERGSP